MSVDDRRARFRALHAGEGFFVMPNPWDIGSARLLASCGFEAMATTSAGFAWSLGKLDQQVSREELVAHVSSLADATVLPLNVDSERCFPDDPGGVAETVALLDRAGAAGFSIEDYDPRHGQHRRRRCRGRARRRSRRGRPSPARADGAHRAGGEPHSRRRRARRHDRPPDRLPRCRRGRGLRAGPRRHRPDRSRRRGASASRCRTSSALPGGPSVGELAEAEGIRRVSDRQSPRLSRLWSADGGSA